MSAGPFTKVYYQDDDGQFWNTRVQPETENTTPANPGATFGSGQETNGYLQVSKGQRERGVIMRKAVLTPAPGATPPTGYKAGQNLKIPILTQSAFVEFRNAAKGNDTVTYLGANWKILSLIGERRNF